MPFGDLFESGEMKEHNGAFRNLGMIARADGEVAQTEKNMLVSMARYLEVAESNVKAKLENPEAYLISPPVSLLDRRERMVDLVRMLTIDGKLGAREMESLERYATGLGYHGEDIPFMVNRIRFYLSKGMNRNGVIEAMISEQ